ncbi:ferritin family protein [Cellulosilyticum sp. I15G10I2]|uniref:ferritin family protein n=1 Tax=Cellulosilyticum sp. I15G10I2 TaxID=1892843 RepID=UPI00085C7F04|nr:ferritin family protein [Cellulosilyticum sp. I15G10I2]
MVRQEQAVTYTLSIRNAMREELQAINQYERHIQESDIHELNEIWQYIVENEKGHYGMLLELLRRLDPEQAVQYENVSNLNFIMPSKIQLVPAVVKRGNLEILNHVRNDIRLELEAVNYYEMILMQSPISLVFQIINTINQDEKEHIELLTKVLRELDADRYGPLR